MSRFPAHRNMTSIHIVQHIEVLLFNILEKTRGHLQRNSIFNVPKCSTHVIAYTHKQTSHISRLLSQFLTIATPSYLFDFKLSKLLLCVSMETRIAKQTPVTQLINKYNMSFIDSCLCDSKLAFSWKHTFKIMPTCVGGPLMLMQ